MVHKISANLSGLCTIYIRPLSFNKILQAIITSSSVQQISCLAMAFLSFKFIKPEFLSLYGGFTVTTSTLGILLISSKSFKSPLINLILCSKLLYFDERFAILTNSSCISTPHTSLAYVLPANMKGIIPVPVHKSTTLAFFLTLAKLARSTASTPNLKACFF